MFMNGFKLMLGICAAVLFLFAATCGLGVFVAKKAVFDPLADGASVLKEGAKPVMRTFAQGWVDGWNKQQAIDGQHVRAKAIRWENMDCAMSARGAMVILSGQWTVPPPEYSCVVERVDSVTHWKVGSLKFSKEQAAIVGIPNVNTHEDVALGAATLSDGLSLTDDLLKRAQGSREIVQSAEDWISNAESHAQKITGVKEYYQKIEAKMSLLVDQERRTFNSVARGQISVTVNQGDVAGSQADLQVDQLWGRAIETPGRNLTQAFENCPSACGSPDDLVKRGAAAQTVEAWESACQQLLAERAKFAPIFKRVMEQWADLKSFQTSAKSRREALVQESNRIQ